jgi:hypothetical protein
MLVVSGMRASDKMSTCNHATRFELNSFYFFRTAETLPSTFFGVIFTVMTKFQCSRNSEKLLPKKVILYVTRVLAFSVVFTSSRFYCICHVFRYVREKWTREKTFKSKNANTLMCDICGTRNEMNSKRVLTR